jgi:plastocyanin
MAGLLVMAVAAMVTLAACGGTTAGSTPAGETKIEVTTTDFAFSPTNWTVPAGQSVSLTLVNNGTQEHEWVIVKKGQEVTIPFDDDDEEKVFWEIEAEPGETATGTFTAPAEAGEYTIVCGVEGHLEAGMRGSLTVR